MPEALNEPLGVVANDEFADELAGLLQALELVQVNALLFQRAHEALGHAVALGLAHVRRGDGAPEPLHLVEPDVGDVLWSPVTPDGQAPRHILAEPAERVTDPLAQ